MAGGTKPFERCEQTASITAGSDTVEFIFQEDRDIVGIDLGLSAGSLAELSVAIEADDERKYDGVTIPINAFTTMTARQYLIQPPIPWRASKSKPVRVTVTSSATAKVVSVILATVPAQ